MYLLSLLVVVVFSVFATHATKTDPPVNVRTAAKAVVANVRLLVERARDGLLLDQLYLDVKGLEAGASDLQLLLPGQASECETKSVIKMAAAGTGSHEVLTVLLAESPLAVLNGRLALSLAVLEHVALQLEDELTLSDDVGAYLSAIVFGTNATATIVEAADKAVKELTRHPASQDSGSAPRARRQIRTSLNLGSGWNVGLRGVSWQSRSGLATFNARPTFSGLKPDGFRASFNLRF